MIKIITIKKEDETLLKSCEKIGSLSLPIYYSYNDFQNTLNSEEIVLYGATLEENGNILGFLVAITFSDRIHILSIACHPNYRREKIGSHLINEIKKLNKNISLYVQSTNKIALEFYKKNNFKKIKEIDDYYHSLEDKKALFMCYLV